MDIFHNFFYVPIFNLLMLIYQLLVENLGIAILLVALIAKLITFPLTRKQMKSAEKSKEFQKKTKEVKDKYKNDQEALAKEMAKLQAEFLPGQLGGCLNLIIVIILLVQVRNVIINLVNQGVHAYNEVAYVEALKLPEDSVTIKLPEEFTEDLQTIDFKVTASDGAVLEQSFTFARTNDTDRTKDLQESINDKTNNLNEEQRAEKDKKLAEQRLANIAIFVKNFQNGQVLSADVKELNVFLRPPSMQTIEYEKLVISINGIELENDEYSYTQGTALNLEFIGADLSRVATDYGFSNLAVVMPYIVISVAVGVTQYISSRIQMGFSTFAKPEEEKSDKPDKKNKKKEDGKEEEPDFAELMQSSTKQMMFIFPVITILMSLGFLGGASIFPTGVSLFWTGQSAFAIIEQLITNRDKVFAHFSSKSKSPEHEG